MSNQNHISLRLENWFDFIAFETIILLTLLEANISHGIKLYSKNVVINIIANKCEANFRLPRRLSNILKKKCNIKNNFTSFKN